MNTMSLTQNFDYLTVTKDYAAPKRHELPDTYEPGRVCEHILDHGEQCSTVVSIYNPRKWCWLHQKHHRLEILAEDGMSLADAGWPVVAGQ